MGSEVEHRLAIDESDHATSLLAKLNQLREDDFDCNITVKVGDKEVKANRHVLCAGSDYFKAMFSHETKELQTGIVEMKNVDFESVKKCLDYIYAGEISVSEDGCEDLFVVASLMQLELLCDKIGLFLAPLLNPAVFFTFLKMATKFNCKTLKQACDIYALNNLGAIAEEEEFQEMEQGYVAFLMRTRKGCSYTEDAKLAVLLKWIKANVDDRKDLFLSMMDLLDLKQISNSYNRHLSENELLCYESAECIGKLHKLSLDNLKARPCEAEVPFSGAENAMIIFDITAKAVQTYHPAKNLWKKLCDMHQDMVSSLGYASAVVGKDLYVFLGTKKVLRINITERVLKWDELEDMLFEHGKHIRVTVLGKFIYAAGEQSFERYSIEHNEWEAVNSNGVILNQCALVTFDNEVYKLGGCENDTSTPVREVAYYSEEIEQWVTLAPMTRARRLCAAFTSKGTSGPKLYVGGGVGEGNYNVSTGRHWERYNEEEDRWTNMSSSFAQNRPSLAMHLISSVRYVVGSSTTIEWYRFKDKKWVEVDVGKEIMAPATVPVWLP